jgi:hypothetical protein
LEPAASNLTRAAGHLTLLAKDYATGIVLVEGL